MDGTKVPGRSYAGGRFDSPSLCSMANRASSKRLDTPSLSKMWVRWCLTVCSLRENVCAMSLFELPATIAATTSSSLAVKLKFWVRAAFSGACVNLEQSD